MKKAIVVTIGDELLQGFTVDSNSSWISSYLRKLNINVEKKITVGDNAKQITSLISEILDEKIDILIMTGGLGPTHDDITKNVLKNYFNCDYLIDNEYLENLKKKYLKHNVSIPDNLESQATYLSNSSPIENLHGTAIGFKINFNNKLIFVLPGVPIEMKQMLKDSINLDNYKKENIFYTLKTSGIYESSLYNILKKTIKENNAFKIAFLPKYSGVDIRISMKENVSNQKFNKFKSQISNMIKKYIYSDSDEKLEEVVAKELIKKNLSLSVAESCTGGLISKKITDLAGSSNFFLGGIVAYSNNMKINILNVNEETINKYGAVSEETAIEMAEGIMHINNSDIAIATTGISGPGGGTKEKPVGLVYVSAIYQNKKIVKKYKLGSNRDINREITSSIAFNIIRLLLKNKI